MKEQDKEYSYSELDTLYERAKEYCGSRDSQYSVLSAFIKNRAQKKATKMATNGIAGMVAKKSGMNKEDVAGAMTGIGKMTGIGAGIRKKRMGEAWDKTMVGSAAQGISKGVGKGYGKMVNGTRNMLGLKKAETTSTLDKGIAVAKEKAGIKQGEAKKKYTYDDAKNSVANGVMQGRDRALEFNKKHNISGQAKDAGDRAKGFFKKTFGKPTDTSTGSSKVDTPSPQEKSTTPGKPKDSSKQTSMDFDNDNFVLEI